MTSALVPVIVEFIPKDPDEGKLYISQEYATAVHRCCCGCGQKVVTPLSPTGWTLTLQDGRASLHPSIGNWSFPCQSHYWIRDNDVSWSYVMSSEEIERGRRHDALLKQRHFRDQIPTTTPDATNTHRQLQDVQPSPSLWVRIKRWILG